MTARDRGERRGLILVTGKIAGDFAPPSQAEHPETTRRREATELRVDIHELLHALDVEQLVHLRTFARMFAGLPVE